MSKKHLHIFLLIYQMAGGFYGNITLHSESSIIGVILSTLLGMDGKQ